MEFVKKHQERLEQFSRMSKTSGGRADYVQGGGGNTSVKLDDTLMAIKASGFCLKDIEIDKAYAVLDYAALRRFYYGSEPSGFEDVEKAGSAEAKAATQRIEGMESLRPSVEAGFHSLLDTLRVAYAQRLCKLRHLRRKRPRDRCQSACGRGLHMGLRQLRQPRQPPDLFHPR